MATKLSVVEQKWREERTNHDDCKLQLKKAGAKSKHYQVHASEYLHLLFLSFVRLFLVPSFSACVQLLLAHVHRD